MITSITNRIWILSAALILINNAIADVSPSTLARFIDGEHSLQNLIEFPDVEGDVALFLYCELRVYPSGGIRGNFCFPSENVDPSFRKEVSTAAKLARASPAIVNGKARTVHLYYRVFFFQKDGASEVGVISNWGHDEDKYGISYEAPQRYSDYRRPNICGILLRRTLLLSTVLIGKDGTLTSDVVFVPELDRSVDQRKCANGIRALLKKAKYIPGHYAGTPVEATFVESWSR